MIVFISRAVNSFVLNTIQGNEKSETRVAYACKAEFAIFYILKRRSALEFPHAWCPGWLTLMVFLSCHSCAWCWWWRGDRRTEIKLVPSVCPDSTLWWPDRAARKLWKRGEKSGRVTQFDGSFCRVPRPVSTTARIIIGNRYPDSDG